MGRVEAVQQIYLNPGDFWFGPAPARVTTLLGSCVAVVLWHPTRREGGMCHYLLPNAEISLAGHGRDGRYAGGAIALFLHELRRRGTQPQDYRVKLFGGADMLVSEENSTTGGSIAARNIAIGLQLLREQGFSVRLQHLGGSQSRKIVFDVATGDVFLKLIQGRQSS